MPTSQNTRSSATTTPFFFTSPFKGNVKNPKAKPGGVLNVKGDTAAGPILHYWLDHLSLAEANAKYFFAIGFTNYSYTNFTSAADWKTAYPAETITGNGPITQPPPPPSPVSALVAPPRPPSTPAASVSTTASGARAPPPPTITTTPAPAPPPAQSVPASTITADSALVNQLLQLLNAQLQQNHLQPIHSPPPIPTWDGTPASVSLFLESLKIGNSMRSLPPPTSIGMLTHLLQLHKIPTSVLNFSAP